MYETDAYAERNPTWHEEDAAWKARHIDEIIRRNNLPSETICEVGCGTGEILVNLARSFPGSQLTGYEISKHAYERAKRKETRSVHFAFGDILESGKSGKSGNSGNGIGRDRSGQDERPRFDVLLLADVIEHVEDYISFLKRIKDVARFKIFHVPLDLSVQSLLRSWPILSLRASVGHIHYFYKDTILATLRDCGYDIVDQRYTASRLELPNQALSSRLMRLPRSLAFALDQDLAVRVLGGYSLLIVAR